MNPFKWNLERGVSGMLDRELTEEERAELAWRREQAGKWTTALYMKNRAYNGEVPWATVQDRRTRNRVARRSRRINRMRSRS